jgi:hypothetical protein
MSYEIRQYSGRAKRIAWKRTLDCDGERDNRAGLFVQLERILHTTQMHK